MEEGKIPAGSSSGPQGPWHLVLPCSAPGTSARLRKKLGREAPVHKGGGKVRHRKPWESQPPQTILISPNTPLSPWGNLLVKS